MSNLSMREEHQEVHGTNHSASAARIARKIGTRVIQRLVVDPTDGELREIQRRSRTISGGRLTIQDPLLRQ